MSAPHDSAANGDGGMLRGHGIAVALVAIFVGMAMVVAFAASEGAIFGLNSSSPAGDTAPVTDSGADGAEVLSRDVFEDSGREGAQSGADKSVGSAPPEQDATFSPEERRLLAMRNFSWDLIAVQYFANSQDIMEMFEQQNFTRQKPAQPEAEPLDLSDRVSVDVDRDIDSEDRVIDIDTPIDTPATNEEEQPEEEEQQDEEPEQEEPQEVEEDNSDSGSGSDDDQSGDFGSGSNSTDTNSTSTEDSGSGSDSSGDDSGIEASVSIG